MTTSLPSFSGAALNGDAGMTRAPMPDAFWIGRRLLEQKVITQEALDSAIEEYRKKPSESFARALERLALASQQQIAVIIADRYKLRVVELAPSAVPAALATLINHMRARAHIVIPFQSEGGVLTLAVADPHNYAAQDAARDFPGRQVRFVVAARSDILAALEQAFSPPLTAANPREFMEKLLREAITRRATDLHLEQKPETLEVRERIDGRLIHRHHLERGLKQSMLQAIKTFAGMDIAERRLPQDGQGKLQVGSTGYTFRVSTIPTILGEDAVIRIQDESRNLRPLSELGLNASCIRVFGQLMAEPEGIIYVTGPTGSGKTTLLYSLMATQDTSEDKVITLEDPVEYIKPSYRQVPIDEKIGRTFDLMMPSLMRQDPDYILVGETRNLETATAAIQAGLTGHKVFSTLHTNDAAGAIVRLINLGIEPFLVSSAVKGVSAVRLIRRLCVCKKPVSGEALAYLCGKHGEGDYHAKVGCPICRGSGYYGRIAICEVYPTTDDESQRLILRNAPSSEFKQHLASLGLPSMRSDGLDKAKAGLTTAEEVLAQV